MAEKKTATEVKEVPAAPAGKKVSQDEKTMAIVAWFIFFVPLLTDQKDSKFVKFHVNQSFNLTLLAIAGYFIATMLAVVLIGFLLMPIIGIATFVLWIIGILSAVNGEMKRLPIIGNIELIK